VVTVAMNRSLLSAEVVGIRSGRILPHGSRQGSAGWVALTAAAERGL